MLLHGGQGLGVHIVGPGSFHPHPLPVQDDGHGQFRVPQDLHKEEYLVVHLVNGGGLGEEVGPDLQAGLPGLLQIPAGIVVLHHVACLSVTPVAQADHGKADAGGLHLLPVDEPLKGGHVNAGIAVLLGAEQVIVAVELEIPPVVGILFRRDGGHLGFLRGGLFRRLLLLLLPLLLQQRLRVCYLPGAGIIIRNAGNEHPHKYQRTGHGHKNHDQLRFHRLSVLPGTVLRLHRLPPSVKVLPYFIIFPQFRQ